MHKIRWIVVLDKYILFGRIIHIYWKCSSQKNLLKRWCSFFTGTISMELANTFSVVSIFEKMDNGLRTHCPTLDWNSTEEVSHHWAFTSKRYPKTSPYFIILHHLLLLPPGEKFSIYIWIFALSTAHCKKTPICVFNICLWEGVFTHLLQNHWINSSVHEEGTFSGGTLVNLCIMLYEDVCIGIWHWEGQGSVCLSACTRCIWALAPTNLFLLPVSARATPTMPRWTGLQAARWLVCGQFSAGAYRCASGICGTIPMIITCLKAKLQNQQTDILRWEILSQWGGRWGECAAGFEIFTSTCTACLRIKCVQLLDGRQ